MDASAAIPKSAGTTAPQCCELIFNYFTVLLTGCSSGQGFFDRYIIYAYSSSSSSASFALRRLPTMLLRAMLSSYSRIIGRATMI